MNPADLIFGDYSDFPLIEKAFRNTKAAATGGERFKIWHECIAKSQIEE